MESNGAATVEEWSAKGDMLKCKNYETKANDTMLLENSTITCIAGKTVFTYYPILKDKKDTLQPVQFVLVSSEDNQFVFENKDHDFPQRVVYQKVNDKECHAWIEGTENGKQQKIDFHYTKAE